MKIPNPWPHHPHIRFNVNNGECLGSCGEGPEIEVPDSAVEVLIEAASNGRADAKILAPARIWSEENGMLEAEDHLKKMKIKEEAEALKVQQETERRRKQEEEMAAKAKKDKEAEERKQKQGRDVNRTASGMAKVTKEPKLKK